MKRRFIKSALRLLAKATVYVHKPTIVALTGSVGKSSTKEAVFTVLKSKFGGRIRRNLENFNTEIGVPLTIVGGMDAGSSVFKWTLNLLRGIGEIFSLKYPHVLVLEFAADRPGDISYLTEIAQPNTGVLTAIGDMPPHLEFFPSRNLYVKEKAEIVRSIKPGGIAVLNIDDEDVWNTRSFLPTNVRLLAYGRDRQADVTLASSPVVSLPKLSRDIDRAYTSFKVEFEGSVVPFRLKGVSGSGGVYAALAASAVGISFGINLVEIANSLESFSPPKGRMTLKKGPKGSIVIDDAYNASPLSMQSALEVISGFSDRRVILIIGDMRELGENNEKAHRALGKKIATIASVICLVGESVKFTHEELEKKGFVGGKNLFYFSTSQEVGRRAYDIIKKGDLVLVKGSHSVGLDTVVRELAE